MLDTDTFLTTLYVMADDFAKTQKPRARPGARPALSDGEVLALALFSQFYFFRSERDFYRFAQTHLRAAFPSLPARSQFNRLLRHRHDLIVGFFLQLAAQLRGGSAYEALDTTALPVRNPKRGGAGHLAGQATIGRCQRTRWYEGFHLLVAVTPTGVITGYGFAQADVREVRLCETFLALRAQPDEAAAGGLACVGEAAPGVYVCDKGFEGKHWWERWRQLYRAEVITPPKQSSLKRRWSAALARQMATLRQIVESSIGALEQYFGLQKDRPHQLDGFRARLAAKVALHNFCIWLNRQLGRSDLAFADLLAR